MSDGNDVEGYTSEFSHFQTQPNSSPGSPRTGDSCTSTVVLKGSPARSAPCGKDGRQAGSKGEQQAQELLGR